uniref:Dead box ATP-dependent RNA helicase n=1 Tax=Rhizophora mucronata TaxID=61149 RepID=A0A2P2M363_RHIMU
MEKDTSFLFAGITFDKKKFAGDFARFKGKKETGGNGPMDDSGLLGSTKSESEIVTKVSKKKRKRKNATFSGNFFVGSHLSLVSLDMNRKKFQPFL